ncbi:MAG: hypothetical protein LPK02_09525 [Rhodobacterales bacterium]|nr:hypothetical protein [Rhodobacterales bacterium]MDX5413270.1 hypothetical protein [Rhodobacterales bacterium]
MIEFLSRYSDILNVVLNAAMVVIWVAYLQVFTVNQLRQARAVLHIDLGAAEGARSRCLVTNLSSSAIYVQAIIAELTHEGHRSRTQITDKDELSPDDVDDPLSRTNRGTLQPGATVDIGSLENLVSRARIRLSEDWSSDHVEEVTITVVAIAGQVDRIVAASKTFDAERSDAGTRFTAKQLLTKQIRPRQTREEFSKMLREQTYQ